MNASATEFENHRPRLTRLAHRMTGSSSDADDVVQDAFLRWHEADREVIRSTEAWLVTAVTRLALDRLRSAKRDRERYVGPWLPDPSFAPAGTTPDAGMELRSDLSYASLVLLERLGPDERAALLLHDVFDVDYSVIADALEKSDGACRQLVHRARERVASPNARRTTSSTEAGNLLERLVAAMEAGDEASLVALFTDDATCTTDGGGKVFAARRVLEGAARIGRVLAQVHRKYGGATHELVFVAGEPAVVSRRDGALESITLLACEDGRIRHLFRVLEPTKVARFAARLEV